MFTEGKLSLRASGPLYMQTVGSRLELSPPNHLDQGPEEETGKCIDWDLVKPKNEKLHDFTNSQWSAA